MEPVIKNKYTISHTVNALLSPLISSLVNNLSPKAFGTLFKTASRFADEENKPGLLEAAQMCSEEDPQVLGWLRALKKLSPNCRKKLIQNLIINHGVLGAKEREQNKEKYGTNIPFLVLLSPTYQCNLECVGCYSMLYGNEYHFTKDEMYNILTQFYNLGVRFFTFTGGEPFVYKYMYEIFEDFNDCYFMIYTNGTLLKENKVKKLAELGNVAITISIEGGEEYTDWRRGEGVFQKTCETRELLKQYGVLTGASLMATSENHAEIMSDEFWNFLVDENVEYVWTFQYMPTGADANFDLVPTPKQRYERFHKLEVMRKGGTFAFLADFWNHGFLVNGCMSGGSNYLHINAKGGAEPCVFQPYAADNVRDKPIIDILRSKFFEGYKKDIPFNDNLMQPCPIIDNPEEFRKHIQDVGAVPQYEGADGYLKFGDQLDSLAKEWEKYAIKIWDEEGYGDQYTAEHKCYTCGGK
ncbi:radical SAM protein [Photobacterium kishitanii]|uniref:radical SAM protein n=1 Tax=Photobacterium kishitanii TaxID=318456 RepID=UPI000D15F579|nr:radical SAM protein [Photobacterium kishitanii]PSV20319.1 radical SAM protein [Photobacterium kishitanii]